MRTDFDDIEVIPNDKPKPVPKEYRIQVAIIDHITGRKTQMRAFNAFVTHIYQGRSAKDGFFLKQLGVVAGVADMIVLWKGGMGFLECKTESGKLSTAQRKFQGVCYWLGVNYAVVRSVKQAHDQLVAWGCPALHNAIKEPNLHSESELYAANHAFFAPEGK